LYLYLRTMKKVLIITYYWPPSGGAGVQRWLKFVKYLPQHGWTPVVLTVDPSKATYPQRDESLMGEISSEIEIHKTSTFELYTLYKKASQNKEVPFGGFANQSKDTFKEKVLKWIRGNFFIPDPRRGWKKFAVNKAKELIKKNHIHCVITSSPPHSTQLIGLTLKRKLGIKWVADLRDPWVDIYYYNQLYPSIFATALNKKYEKRVLSCADQVITVSRDLQRIFSRKKEGIGNKIHVIPNGFDTDDFTKTNAFVSNESLTISYVGTISEKYTIHGFIKGLLMLPEEMRKRLKIRFIGTLSDALYQTFCDAGFTHHLEVIGYVNHAKAIAYMVSSDILLLIIPDVPNNAGIVTGKLFEYIATMKPVLCIGPVDGDAANILSETNTGSTFGYNDSKGISEFLIERSTSGFREFPKKEKIAAYSRFQLTGELVRILESG
jgi:glycosyltransferase involved in cell wall biosynthesis